jgi:CRP-like cAMP-binding protein
MAGSLIYAQIFGTVTSLMMERDRNKTAYSERVRKITEFVRANNLPVFIRHRLERYLEASWQLRKVETTEVLEGVPNSAKIELMMFLYADLLTQVPIFAHCSKRFLERVCLKFEHAIFLGGDYIIRQGDPGEELYFIIRGKIEVYCANASEAEAAAMDFDEIVVKSYLVVTRGPGAFIGEGSLLFNNRRGASVLAITSLVQTLFLTKTSFEECVKGSPEVLDTIRNVAEFRQKLNTTQLPERTATP